MNDPQCGHMLGAAGASDLQIGHCIRRDSLPQLFGEGKRESYRLVPGVTDEGATQAGSDHNVCYSSASGCKPMFFSPAAFFSLYFFIQASQVLPAAVSLPEKTRAAMSAYEIEIF